MRTRREAGRGHFSRFVRNSLAGLHRVADCPAVFAAVRGMLKPGGRACFADVTAGSPVDAFLNGFVNRHISMGHHGEFISDAIARVRRLLASSRPPGLMQRAARKTKRVLARLTPGA